MTSVHGHARVGHVSPTYVTWKNMIQRCTYVAHHRYPAYGGRGITVCERWRVFANFLADMGERPQGMTLDRIDNDGNYEKSNCQWATREQQDANHRRRTHCKNGHPLSGDNLYIRPDNAYICRRCQREDRRKRRATS